MLVTQRLTESGDSQRNQQQDAKWADEPRGVPVLPTYVSDAEDKHGSHYNQGNCCFPAHQSPVRKHVRNLTPGKDGRDRDVPLSGWLR